MRSFATTHEKTGDVALIKSISGIRGTIGGRPGENLTPIDIVRFTSAFGHWLKGQSSSHTVVVGRDGRISGPLVSELVVQTLMALGLDVADIGLSTTPTVEMAVTAMGAAGSSSPQATTPKSGTRSSC
jgi:phosphomannomutase